MVSQGGLFVGGLLVGRSVGAEPHVPPGGRRTRRRRRGRGMGEGKKEKKKRRKKKKFDFAVDLPIYYIPITDCRLKCCLCSVGVFFV